MVDRARVNGAELTLKDLKGVLETHRLREGAMSLRDWRLLLALQLGDVALKAREAFALLDQNGDGLVELNALKRLIQLFEVSSQTSDAIAIEIARDGSESFDLQHLLDYLPEQFESHPRAFVGAHRWVDAHAATKKAASDGNGSAKHKSHILKGTSPLQMQIGWFRLIQGAAYRSFRESYSANSETHLRAYDLPYTISDFVRFVNAAVDLYLALGIVEDGAEEPFESLRTSVIRAEVDLRDRMANWDSIPHTEAMLEGEGRL